MMKRCERDAAYRVIVHDDRPNFRTISGFRTIYLAELEGLFIQVLRLCQKAGLVKLGTCVAGQDEGESECIPAQGDELRADEGGGEASSPRDPLQRPGNIEHEGQ